jgi:hypothetical protein
MITRVQPTPIPLRPDPTALQRDALSSLVRAAIATGLSKLDTTVRPTEYARKTWDDRRVELILRAAVSPASLSNTPSLAQVSVAFLESLLPVSAGADLLARGIGLNFSGAAQISVPALSPPSPGADFLAEGAPIPVAVATSSAGPTLLPHKLAVITTLTREMMTNTNAETLIRQALIESTGPAVDKVLFSANAAGTDRPAGLLNGIAALTPSGPGEKAQALVDDLQQLATAVAPVAGNGDIVLIAAPAQAVAIRLRLPASVDWPVLTSASMAAGTVIAVAASSVVSAVEGAPQIDASNQTELVRDTAPTSIDDALTAPMQYVGSIYQTDQIALRLRWPISWALRTPAGLAWMQGVNW